MLTVRTQCATGEVELRGRWNCCRGYCRTASGENLCCRDIRTRHHDNPTRTLRVSRHRELHEAAVLDLQRMLQA